MATVFVHGAPNGPEIWNPLIRALNLSKPEYTNLALPGFATPCPTGFEPGRDNYANWLIKQFELIAADADGVGLRIVAHDFGAIFALRACSLRPQLVESWIICGSLIDSETKPHLLAKLFRLPIIGNLVTRLMTNRRVVAKGLCKQGVPKALAESQASGLDKDLARCILALYQTQRASGQVHPWETDLKSLPRRGLLIWGDADPYVSSYAAKRFAERRGVPLHVLARTGHWPFVQRPNEVAARISEFWSAE
ncbi:MAG: alpha/beta hydrolase [Planctomycetota bacterium]